MKFFSETPLFDCGIDAKRFGENTQSLSITNGWTCSTVLTLLACMCSLFNDEGTHNDPDH